MLTSALPTELFPSLHSFIHSLTLGTAFPKELSEAGQCSLGRTEPWDQKTLGNVKGFLIFCTDEK